MAENNTGYSTFLVSTASLVIESKKIVVFNKTGKSEFAFLSINNIEEKYNKLISDYTLEEDYFILERADTNSTTPFVFPKNETGFNVIIYINNNKPVGFTEFFNAQGLLGDILKIFIKFNIKTTKIEITFDNHIKDIIDSVSLPVIIGTKKYDYSNSSDVISSVNLIPSYNKYSSHIGSGNNIFLRNRVIDSSSNSSLTIYKKPTINDVAIDSTATRFNIGLVGDNITLFAWNELSFWVYNLTSGTTVKFGTLTKFESRDTEILYGTGHYIVCRVKMSISYSRTVLYDFDNSSWISYNSGNVLINEYDNKQKIKYIEPLEQTNLSLEEYSNIQLNLETFIKEKVNEEDQLIYLERLVGNWVVLRCIALGEIYYIISGKYITIKLSEEYYKNSMIVNDNIVLVNYSKTYYKIFYGLSDSILSIDDGVNIVKNTQTYKTKLNSLRQTDLYTVPSDIIGAFRGLIFYKDSENKIKIC